VAAGIADQLTEYVQPADALDVHGTDQALLRECLGDGCPTRTQPDIFGVERGHRQYADPAVLAGPVVPVDFEAASAAHVDDARGRDADTVIGQRFERDRLGREQVAPALVGVVARAAGELHEHVRPASGAKDEKLRRFPAGGRSDRAVGCSARVLRVGLVCDGFDAAASLRPKALKRLFAEHEVADQVLAAACERDQPVIVMPVGQPRRQAKIAVPARKAGPEEALRLHVRDKRRRSFAEDATPVRTLEPVGTVLERAEIPVVLDRPVLRNAHDG